MSRFFVAPENVGAEYITIENREDLHHMNKVLRLKAGDEIDVSDGDMWEYHGKILSLEPEYCQVKILDKQRFSAEPETKITLISGNPQAGQDGADRAESRGAGCLRDRTGVYGSDGSDG